MVATKPRFLNRGNASQDDRKTLLRTSRQGFCLINKHMARVIFFLASVLISHLALGQWSQSYGDSTLSNEVRMIPANDCTIVYTSPGRDFLHLHNCQRTMIWVGQWGDCLLPLYPANAPGAGACDDGRYDQVHYFNCNTDLINLSGMGALSSDDIIWLQAAPGYGYHYLVVDQIKDGCNITWAIAFRADRFYGSFSVAQNVLYNQQATPFHLRFESNPPAHQEEAQEPQEITVWDFSGRMVYKGHPDSLRLPEGMYVAVSGGKRFKMMVTAN